MQVCARCCSKPVWSATPRLDYTSVPDLSVESRLTTIRPTLLVSSWRRHSSRWPPAYDRFGSSAAVAVPAARKRRAWWKADVMRPMNVQLREITKESVRKVCALEVRDDQKGYVAANALSLAQAHFEPTAVFRAIYLAEEPIGFIQWRNAEQSDVVVLWRFMIDQSHQSAGHGRSALTIALHEMKSSGFEVVETSVVLGPSSPLAFYLSQGFTETNQVTPRSEWLLRKPL